MTTHAGRLIAVEGTDGAGKKTQCAALKTWLETTYRLPVELVDFPQYDTFYGQMIARYLRGDFGTHAADVNPYFTALLYAADRASIRETLTALLATGTTIIANRYVGSNLAFQVAKLTNADERAALRRWIGEMEYGANRLPRPDATLLLHMPLPAAQQLIAARPQRAHLQQKADIHETDLPFLARVEAEYLDLAREPGWQVIPCVTDNALRSPAAITADMCAAIAPLFA